MGVLKLCWGDCAGTANQGEEEEWEEEKDVMVVEEESGNGREDTAVGTAGMGEELGEKEERSAVVGWDKGLREDEGGKGAEAGREEGKTEKVAAAAKDDLLLF